MSNLDITNDYEIIFTDLLDFTANGDFFTSEIDTANSDPGFAFAFMPLEILSGMTLNIKLQDNDGSGWLDIPDNKIISETGINLIQILADPSVPGNLSSLGAFSNSKLVRAKITVANRSVDVEFAAIVYKKKEQLPPSGD